MCLSRCLCSLGMAKNREDEATAAAQPALQPRDYQQYLLEKAIKENVQILP